VKWFKHLSNARDDERIARLEDVAGLEGYAVYFKLLEIVAASMDQTERCEVGYSVSRWASLMNCHPIKARTLVGKVASCGLVELRLDGDSMEVRIPNLLKHRDNHTKNLQAACKQEVEKEKEEEREKKSPDARASRLPPDWTLPKDWLTWALAEKPTWPEYWARAAADRFKDHWVAKAGAAGRKLDWQATWRNWVRGTNDPPKGVAADKPAWAGAK